MALKKEIMAKGKSKGKRPLRRNEVASASSANVSDMRRRRLVNEDMGTTSTALKMKLKLVQDIAGGIIGEHINAIQPQLATILKSRTELFDSEENPEEEPLVEETFVGAPFEKFFNLLMLADVAAEVAEAEQLQCKACEGFITHPTGLSEY